jgi:hypothetical protein
MLSSFDLERETITKGTEEKKIGNAMKKITSSAVAGKDYSYHLA